MRDLQKEKLALFILPKGPLSIAQVQGQLMGERLLSEFYFCDSAEEITVLVASGYGILALLALLLPDMPLIAKLPLKDTELVSFWNLLSGAPGQSGAESPDPMCQGVFCAAACVGSKKKIMRFHTGQKL